MSEQKPVKIVLQPCSGYLDADSGVRDQNHTYVVTEHLASGKSVDCVTVMASDKAIEFYEGVPVEVSNSHAWCPPCMYKHVNTFNIAHLYGAKSFTEFTRVNFPNFRGSIDDTLE